MQKDFKKWNEKKEKIHENERRLFFYEREVWWCSLGANVGDEQDGTGKEFVRPVIVLKKFNKHLFWGIPLTTKEKKGKYYFSFLLSDRRNTAILSQMRLFDSKIGLTHGCGNIRFWCRILVGFSASWRWNRQNSTPEAEDVAERPPKGGLTDHIFHRCVSPIKD